MSASKRLVTSIRHKFEFFVKNFGDAGLKPQWKAAIDFKWIRDNKDAVAVNIRNRNSNANLELVLELYEKMSNLQKVNIAFTYSFLSSNLHYFVYVMY